MDQATEEPEIHEEQEEKVYDYYYTGSQQIQPWGEETGPSWTAHDDPTLPGYISLGPGPLY